MRYLDARSGSRCNRSSAKAGLCIGDVRAVHIGAEARDADVIAKAIRAHRRAAQALVAMAHAPEVGDLIHRFGMIACAASPAWAGTMAHTRSQAPTAVSKDFVSKLWVDHTKNPEHGMSELTAQRRFVEASALYLKYA